MTMEVTVTNKDTSRVASVGEEEFNPEKVFDVYCNKTRIGPGESRSFWIHAAKRLIIREDPDSLK